MAPFLVTSDFKLIKGEYNRVVKEGGEGIIVKSVRTVYIDNSKSKEWIKVKKEVDGDFVVMGFTKTSSKAYAAKGWIGAVEVGLYENGKLKKVMQVGSMSEEVRDYFSKTKRACIGRVVTVYGFERFKSGALRHPSFAGTDLDNLFREDKSPKECVL
jgi:ATP-dependent DNA ligase